MSPQERLRRRAALWLGRVLLFLPILLAVIWAIYDSDPEAAAITAVFLLGTLIFCSLAAALLTYGEKAE